MKYKIPAQCPVCSHPLSVNKLVCNHCSTMIEGDFAPCKFCRLPDDQLEFLEAFVRCRGNIKEVEKELGISYPTVRSRLDGLIEALGYQTDKGSSQAGVNQRSSNQAELAAQRQSILHALEQGEMTAQEAAVRLRKTEKP